MGGSRLAEGVWLMVDFEMKFGLEHEAYLLNL